MDKKISELDQALQINNDAVFPFSQDNSGEDTTYKASITQLGTEIGEGMTFSNLQTSSKKLVGAINEIAQGGGGGGGSSNHNIAPDYDDTSTYAVGDWCIYEGNLYQCNTAIPTAESFTPAHWTAKKVVDALDDIEDELDDKVDKADYTADMLPITSGGVSTKAYIDSGLSAVESQISGLVKMKSFTATTDAYGNVKIPDLDGNNSIILSISSAGARFATGLTAENGEWYFKVITNTANITSVVNTSLNFYVWYIAL